MSRNEKPRAGLRPALLAVAALVTGAAAFVAWRAEIFRAPSAPLARKPRVVAAASAASARHEPDAEQYPLAAARLREWSQRAPREAWNWVRENSARLSPPDEPSLIAVFFRHLAARDPDAVLAFANESLACADSPAIASAAINALLENNWPTLAREQVERWARDEHTPVVGASPFQAVAWQLARESDRTAADWLLALPASPERDTALAGTAANWAEHDPRAAMGWSLDLANADARATALERTFRIWADHDADAAADWLLEHESRPEADRLIAAWLVASPAARENPRLALQWTALIHDDDARRASHDRVLANWRERDALAAASYTANPP